MILCVFGSIGEFVWMVVYGSWGFLVSRVVDCRSGLFFFGNFLGVCFDKFGMTSFGGFGMTGICGGVWGLMGIIWSLIAATGLVTFP
jgi:hypothetical protein